MGLFFNYDSPTGEFSRKESRAEKLQGLMQGYDKVTTEGTMKSFNYDENGNETENYMQAPNAPIVSREGGYMSSQKTPEDLSMLAGGLASANFTPVEQRTILQPMMDERSAYADLMNSQLTAGTKTVGDTQKQVNVLRKNINDSTKNFNIIDEAYKKIKKVGGNKTAASDMGLVFSYMKLLDPNSTVREGEYASAKNAAGIPTKIQTMYNNALDGTILGAEQRTDFMNTSGDIYNAQRESTDMQISNVLEQADQDEIDRVRVFGKDRLNAYNKRASSREQAELSDEELLNKY